MYKKKKQKKDYSPDRRELFLIDAIKSKLLNRPENRIFDINY